MKNRKKSLSLFVSTIIATLLHTILLPLFLNLIITLDKPLKKSSSRYIQLSFLNTKYKTEKKKKREYKYKPLEKIPEGQIVNAPKAGKEEKTDTKYISLRDQKVKKETKARVRIPGVKQASNKTMIQNKERKKGTKFNGLDLKLAYMKLPKYKDRKSMVPSSKEKMSLIPEKKLEKKNRFYLYPTLAQISKVLSGTGLDLLKDVDEGEETLLNTKQWKFASFFLRVKAQIEQYWRPDIAFLTHDPTGRIYGYKDRETIVRVVLNEDGSLKDIFIIKPSGAPFLDREALHAIKRASPFPNPPKELIDPKEKIIVFNCAFFVEVGSSPILHIKRY